MSRNESLPKGLEPLRSAFPVNDPLQPDSSRASTLPRLLTASEVAAILNVSRSAVYHLAERRRLGHVKTGTCLRFHHDDLAKFLEEHRVEARAN